MAEHPIQGIMNVTMDKIHEMVDANTHHRQGYHHRGRHHHSASVQGELWFCLRRHRL